MYRDLNGLCGCPLLPRRRACLALLRWLLHRLLGSSVGHSRVTSRSRVRWRSRTGRRTHHGSGHGGFCGNLNCSTSHCVRIGTQTPNLISI
ncbi:hypothetical protein BS78_01G254900 [Paspalum vaginatum]|nr:hypothetical protein BS78_01G254900 [Paspalum vaginatum]